METAVQVIQIVIGLGIYNVWLLRSGKPTPWRGGEAQNLREEFAAYGLPGWAFPTIGFFKLLFATGLIVGAWVPSLTLPSAAGLAALMLGAVAMHVKVSDPLQRSLPAATLLVLASFVAAMAA